jgi:periplasmic protein TonB
LKRFLLAAVLALVLHALLMTAKVEWTKEESLPPPSPIRLFLSYKTPESRETSPPSFVKPPEKAPDLPVAEKLEEPKRDPAPKQRPPLPKKKPIPRATAKETAPEIREVAETAESRPVAEENTETASGMEIPPSISPATPSRPTASGIPDTFLTPPRSSPDPAASRQAVPLYLKNPPPEYPPAARRRGYEGTIMMEVFVDREGKVQDLRLLRSSGYDMLDRAAMRAVKGWRFAPARQGEENVDMWVTVPLTFRLKE